MGCGKFVKRHSMRAFGGYILYSILYYMHVVVGHSSVRYLFEGGGERLERLPWLERNVVWTRFGHKPAKSLARATSLSLFIWQMCSQHFVEKKVLERFL